LAAHCHTIRTVCSEGAELLFSATLGETGPHQRRTACLRGARLAHILDLLAEDSRLNVYAGELEVCPLGAPTPAPHWRISNAWQLLNPFDGLAWLRM
jgi:hypothetical protein